MNARTFALLTVVATLSVPIRVRAQSGPGREAQRLFSEGVAALEHRDFATAVQRLEAARSLHEAPGVLLNLALAQRGLERFVDADHTIGRYLELAAGRINAARRAEIDSLRGEVSAALAEITVRVDSAPPSAIVTLDGRRLTDTEINHPIHVDPVEHVLRIEGAGLQTRETRHTFARGEHADVSLAVQTVAADLPALPTVAPPPTDAALRVESSVADATVYVDHRPVGRAPFQSRIAPGSHEIDVRADNHVAFHAQLAVTAGRDERVFAPLRPVSYSIATRWWFWSAAAAVVAGATVGLVVGLSGTEAPVGGSTNRVIQGAVAF